MDRAGEPALSAQSSSAQSSSAQSSSAQSSSAQSSSALRPSPANSANRLELGAATGGFPASAEGPRGREIEYRVRPGSLDIEVAGVWLRPRSRVVSLGPGRYGVALNVGVQVIDEQPHAISTATGRGLALAAERFGPADGSERFPDARRGGSSPVIELSPEQETELRASWPLPGQPGLARGQRLHLEVGLWGLSRPGEPTQPVWRLFSVDVAEMGPGQPWMVRVSPPPTRGEGLL